MKLQKAKKLCKWYSEIDIIQGPDGEWLSNGNAAWECQTMGLTASNVRALMDVDEKEVPDNNVREIDMTRAGWMTAFIDEHNDVLLLERGTIWLYGHEYMILTPERGDDKRPVYIDVASLEPVKQKQSAEYRLRTDGDGYKYVAVCYGVTVCAIITPMSRTPEDSDVKGGANRIESWITEMWAMIQGKTPEELELDRE